jgi:hypothetical protein
MWKELQLRDLISFYFPILNPVALYHTGLVVSFQSPFQLLAENYHICFHLNI